MPRRPRPFPISSFSQEVPEEPRYLLRDRIPLEGVSLAQGDGAAGKSTLMRFVAARVSRGDLPGDLDGPANVLWLNAEEHVGRDIRPGLDRQGADVSRIFRPADGVPILRFPQHLDRLHDTVIALNARLIAIDQVSAFIAGSNEGSVRSAMSGLREIAEDCGCAIVLSRNLNGAKSADFYRRGRGGGLLIDICRAAFQLILHPDDDGDPDGRRLLITIKGNIHGRTTRALVISRDADGRTVLGEEVDLDPRSLAAQVHAAREEGQAQLALAVALLLDVLAGREVPTLEVEEVAAERGISLRTVSRARASIGVLHRRVSHGNPDGSTTHLTVLRLPGFVVPVEALPVPPPPPPSAQAPWAMSATSPSGSASSTPSPTESDDSAKRFSLLELDEVGGVGEVAKPSSSNGIHPTLPSLPSPPAASGAP